MANQVFVPEYITVHLGEPDDKSAQNVVVPFTNYIKNVASSEVFPTWPDTAIRANVYAQVSYALNRVYTEWYRSKGYDFDITNTTKYDQKFIQGRSYFENIVKIVDEIFNDYIVKGNAVEPLFASFCDGKQVQCPGLSQWGTVELANNGLMPYEILQHYYGSNINLVKNAPIKENIPSYSGVPLQKGSSGDDVHTIKCQLNRISINYPAIPRYPVLDKEFNLQTESAVKKAQEIFNLKVDGIVGKQTWYKLKFIYVSVSKIAELKSENVTMTEILCI